MQIFTVFSSTLPKYKNFPSTTLSRLSISTYTSLCIYSDREEKGFGEKRFEIGLHASIETERAKEKF